MAGFAGLVQRICELQAGDRGLSDLLCMTLSADEQVEELRRTANEQVATLIGRAKAAGRLREDFAGEDLVLLLIATAAVMHVTRADAPDAWRRFVALALDGFRRRDSSRLPEAPSTAQLTRAMLRLAAERGCGGRPDMIAGGLRPASRRTRVRLDAAAHLLLPFAADKKAPELWATGASRRGTATTWADRVRTTRRAPSLRPVPPQPTSLSGPGLTAATSWLPMPRSARTRS